MLDRPERIDVLTDLLTAHPEVTGVELWALANATIRPQDKAYTEDDESDPDFWRAAAHPHVRLPAARGPLAGTRR